MTATVGPAKTSCMAYYPHGAVSTAASSDGSHVTMSADSTTNYAAPQTVTTQSYSETLAYNSWLGVTQTTGANGEQLSMTYDTYGRPKTGTSPYGAVTTYSYSAAGVTPVQQMRTGPDGFTRTTLDGVGRTVKVERGPNASTIQSVVDTVYAPCACSPLAKLQKTSMPYAPGGSPVWTVNGYDGIGRTLTVTQPDGSVTTYSYAGNQTTVTDPAGKWKTFTNDVDGNLVTVTEPDPANMPGGTLITSYSYDWMKHLAGVTMPRGGTTQTRTFVYDDAGRLTSATNPENGTVSYSYNADNTLAYKHDAKGQDTVYSYDSQKRVTVVKRYPTGQANAEDSCARVSYSYGASTGSGNTYGRLASVSYTAGCNSHNYGLAMTESYGYHAAGAITYKGLQFPRGGSSVGTSVSYGLDSAGRMISLTDGSGAYPLSYGYDSMGRPNSLIDTKPSVYGNPNLAMVQNVVYDFAGRMTSLQYASAVVPNGGTNPYYTYTVETLAYNVNGQLTSMNWSNGNTIGQPSNYGNFGGLTGGLQYAYAAGANNGQITGVTDSLSGETIAYQYDALKRLTSATSVPTSGSSVSGWTQSFSFDGFGNLTGKTLNGTTTSIAVNGATNQLSSAGYDANGNMTSGAGVSLTYDEANRVAWASPTSGGTEYYGYAPDNKRIYRRTATGTEELTWYGAKGEKLAVFQIGGNSLFLTSRYVWFAGKLIQDGNGVFQDRLGTNRANGARYLPFGEELTATTGDHVKFGTYTRDSFTGLDYADQRYYASWLGRFNTADPYRASAGAGDPGSWNRYSYVQGDPINFRDRRGLERECSEDCDIDTNPCIDDPSIIGCDDTPDQPRRTGGLGGGTSNSAFPQLKAGDRKTFNTAVTRAQRIVKDAGDKCDGALADSGIPSLAAILQDSRLTNGGDVGTAIYDGRTAGYSQNVSTGQTVAQYFQVNRSTVGAEVFLPNIDLSGDTGASNVMFLGPAFFEPSLAGVSGTNTQLAQAFIILHEAVHLVGDLRDSDFGGSKQLTQKLVNNCFPAAGVAGWLGGLYK